MGDREDAARRMAAAVAESAGIPPSALEPILEALGEIEAVVAIAEGALRPGTEEAYRDGVDRLFAFVGTLDANEARSAVAIMALLLASATGPEAVGA